MWGRAAKILSALAAPLLLAGCFLTPGAFDSSLDLRRSGDFTFAYKGEVVFTTPDDLAGGGKPVPWSDDLAVCYDDRMEAVKPKPTDGAKSKDMTVVMPSPIESRKCSPAEIAEQRKVHEENNAAAAKRKAEESKQFAAMFGFAPGDDAANRRLATQLAKYDGFRSVTYAGNGVFNVDYLKTGRLDHDFVFPVMPQGNVLFPFVMVRPQKDGAVRVSAPSLVGNGALGALARMKEAGLGGASAAAKLPDSRTQGRFVITTDGEVLTNNTEDGPAAGANGRTLTWAVDARSTVAPEALVRVK